MRGSPMESLLGRNLIVTPHSVPVRSIPANRLSSRYVTEDCAVYYTYHHHPNDSRHDDYQRLE
jgi:hypothetical protein